MNRTIRNLDTKKIRGCFCLDYTGGKFASGYGALWHQGRVMRAHRVAYIEANGPIPKDALVLHHCDRRICVEPNHLYLGSHQDNVDDRMRRGRHVSSNLRHSDAKVEAIRKAHGHQADIARRFGVTQGYVSQVKRGLVRK